MPFLVNTSISNLDLKSIFTNKKVLINMVLVIVVLIISSNIYSRLNRMNAKLKEQIISEKKKNELLNQLAKSEEKISLYKERLQKKEITSIITTVNRLVQDSGLKIISIKPETEQDYATYNKSAVRVFILADNYHKIGDFISRLESAPDLYKIETLYIKTNKRYGSEFASQETTGLEQGLSIEIVVSRFTFK